MNSQGFIPSHYLVRVDDLKQAVDDYKAAGFTVIWGSDPMKAYNAFIYFSKGGFIELFNPPVNGVLKAIATVGALFGLSTLQRYQRWIKFRGFCDYALETESDLNDILANFDLAKARHIKREGVDGVLRDWDISLPKGSPYLPFVMGPYNPPLKISPESCKHENGISSLLGMSMSHPEPEHYAKQLAQLLKPAKLSQAADCFTVESSGFRIVIERGDMVVYRALVTDSLPPESSKLHGLRLETEQMPG